jgi:hypothetical protein
MPRPCASPSVLWHWSRGTGHSQGWDQSKLTDNPLIQGPPQITQCLAGMATPTLTKRTARHDRDHLSEAWHNPDLPLDR